MWKAVFVPGATMEQLKHQPVTTSCSVSPLNFSFLPSLPPGLRQSRAFPVGSPDGPLARHSEQSLCKVFQTVCSHIRSPGLVPRVL
ncbi:hypothetical protein E2C01_009013 [Portunus trituberculatus]|uniref:Uncharacterized protein n=1 Tax=Portunus trituberculatus TaxID=210409 RepID=A0A5B7D5N6_PORTR|nr:hypothetical protein [Portunus trituberculatus]